MSRFRSLVAACLVLTPAAALAQSQAPPSILVIHGLPGGDLQQPRELPVDISVNGACAVTRLSYRGIVGPLTVPAGTYAIAVHYPATGSCSSPAALGPANIPFYPGESSTVIAHVGADGRPTASKFVNNLAPTAANRARAAIHHTANAPAVDVYLTRAFGTPTSTIALTTGLVPGEHAGAAAAVFGPAGLGLSADNLYSLYVVGSVANNTLDVIADVRTTK
jgi:hypothetical protein